MFRSLQFLLLLGMLLGWSPPAGAERILIVAPHPDDETISLGGWVADQVASGSEVWAVVVTDGARFPRAIRARSVKPTLLFRPHDFRKLGRRRRLEASCALKNLGVPAEHRIFLGYPSGAMAAIYQTPRWDTLVTCRALGQRYGVAEWGGKRQTHPFSRRALVGDIDRLLDLAKPDLIVLPVAFDSNVDHQAVSRLFIERMQFHQVPARQMGYLVHLGSRKVFPRPFGYQPEGELLDPPRTPPAVRYYPSRAGLAAKEKAIRCHRSQLGLRDGFLLSFIRRVELWWPGGKTTR
ncbi:MAG: PIG-L family deacetylase [Candidatus Riflebacteria bacterium]|nr:PIG-L family deacetylase [Candidatus Riflebacteria bacterium]